MRGMDVPWSYRVTLKQDTNKNKEKASCSYIKFMYKDIHIHIHICYKDMHILYHEHDERGTHSRIQLLGRTNKR